MKSKYIVPIILIIFSLSLHAFWMRVAWIGGLTQGQAAVTIYIFVVGIASLMVGAIGLYECSEKGKQ